MSYILKALLALCRLLQHLVLIGENESFRDSKSLQAQQISIPEYTELRCPLHDALKIAMMHTMSDQLPFIFRPLSHFEAKSVYLKEFQNNYIAEQWKSPNEQWEIKKTPKAAIHFFWPYWMWILMLTLKIVWCTTCSRPMNSWPLLIIVFQYISFHQNTLRNYA